jgi:hypothetical protein
MAPSGFPFKLSIWLASAGDTTGLAVPVSVIFFISGLTPNRRRTRCLPISILRVCRKTPCEQVHPAIMNKQ